MARKSKGQGQILSGSPQPNFSNFQAKTIQANRAPTTADTGYEIGQQWADMNNNIIYGLASVAAGAAQWNLLGPGSSDVDTLTGDAGGAIMPAGGNITLAGGTNIATSGAGSTITFNLDAAISLATSVTSPIYTTSGADMSIAAAAGQDIIMTLGDSAGANNFTIEALDGTDVFSVDSTGAITFTNFVNTGTFTTSGGTASINASSNFNTVINSGTSTGTVTIGNSAAGAVTVDSGAGISVDAATASNFTVTGAGQDLTLASSGGSVKVNSTEDAAGAIALSANGGVTETITITAAQGTGAASVALTSTAGGITLTGGLGTADAVNIACSNAAGGVDIDSGTGGVAIDSTAAFSIDGATASNVTVTGASQDLTLSSSGGSVNMTASEAAANAIRIQASDAAGGIDIDCGTGGAALDSTGGISLDATTASNFTVTGAADLTLTSTAGSIPITAGEADAAAIALQAAAGGLDIDLGLALIADAAGNIELNSSAGQILIGNDAVNQNMSIGTAGARTVTVGSTTGASALVLQGGTGDITVTGTVKQIDAEFLQASGVYIPTINSNPVMSTAANTGGAPTGATGDTNLMAMQNGAIMEQFIIGAGQTIIAPRMDANGLLISLDLTNTEGAEYNFGARNLSKCAFTIGTSAAFFFQVGLYINDMDGAAPYVIGFRKVEANNATFADYTDYATIGMIAGSSTTNIVTATELNAGGQTVTDTTDAWGGDGSTNTLAVLVSAAGVVTYTINGSAPSASAAFTFDNGDVVMPFIRIGHSAAATQVDITSLKCGFQA